jgi:PAS domain S-box-containing protein
MRDEDKTRDQLIAELAALRRQVAEFEKEKTDREMLHRALEESEKRFGVIFDHLRDGLLLADKETKKFLMGNPAIHEMLGYSPEELAHLGLSDIHPEEDLPYVIDRFEGLARREIEIARDIPVKRKDGSVFYADISSSFPIEFHQKECVMGVFRDVTKRRRSEKTLQESEARYRHIFENAVEGIYQSSPDGRYIEVNPAFARIFGYDSPEELKNSILDIGSQLYLDPTVREACMRKVREQGAAVLEVQFRRKDGSTGWVSNNVRAVRDRDGNITHFEGVAEDITERKRAEEELWRAHNELEERVEERTTELKRVNDQLVREILEHNLTLKALMQSEKDLRFLSSRLLDAQEEERKRIARELHDSIGQSLVAIKFSVENLLQGAGSRYSNKLAKPLGVVVSTIQGAIEEARRIYTGLRPSILDDLGIHATISWFCREFRSAFPGINVDEQLEVEEDEIPQPIKIVIFRLVQEALNNVAKYSEAEQVNVSLMKAAHNIELAIVDDGKGFDPQELISQNAHEKGLGITGMRERTEFSGGTFVVESGIARGTTIRASWPFPA